MITVPIPLSVLAVCWIIRINASALSQPHSSPRYKVIPATKVAYGPAERLCESQNMRLACLNFTSLKDFLPLVKKSAWIGEWEGCAAEYFYVVKRDGVVYMDDERGREEREVICEDYRDGTHTTTITEPRYMTASHGDPHPTSSNYSSMNYQPVDDRPPSVLRRSNSSATRFNLGKGRDILDLGSGPITTPPSKSTSKDTGNDTQKISKKKKKKHERFVDIDLGSDNQQLRSKRPKENNDRISLRPKARKPLRSIANNSDDWASESDSDHRSHSSSTEDEYSFHFRLQKPGPTTLMTTATSTVPLPSTLTKQPIPDPPKPKPKPEDDPNFCCVCQEVHPSTFITSMNPCLHKICRGCAPHLKSVNSGPTYTFSASTNSYQPGHGLCPLCRTPISDFK